MRVAKGSVKDPSQAADPKYAFLFSAAHMQASPMVRNSVFGFTTAGMAGNATDRQADKKVLAYTKAYEILLRHKAEDDAAAPAKAAAEEEQRLRYKHSQPRTMPGFHDRISDV